MMEEGRMSKDRSRRSKRRDQNGQTENVRELPGIHSGGEPRLLKGIAVLGVAAVISKLLGTIQKIPLQNLAGDEAYGIYSVVYPFYVLVLFLTTAGFPVAVSKLVSEQVATGNWREARRIYHVSSVILVITGTLAFLLLYTGAGHIAGWIGASHAEHAIRSISFALLLVPYMAAVRGYYQGLQDMVPTAVSQVAEQTVRVAVMIVLIIYLTNLDASSGTIAAGATFGSAAGAAAGLAVMLLYDVRRQRHSGGRRHQSSQHHAIDPDGSSSAKTNTHVLALARRISRHALPVAIGSVAVPVISMIDSFTLPNMLVRFHDLGEHEALERFGVYARGLPLVQLVAMLFSSVAVALVPSLSNARARGEHDLIIKRSTIALRLTWMIGLAASCGLAVASMPINIMLFTDAKGTWTMAIVAWIALFSSLNVVTAAILQGLGREKLPAIHLLSATVVKIVLNIMFIPFLGIAGAAWSGVIAYAIAGWLNLRAVIIHTGLSVRTRNDVSRPVLSVIIMTGVLLILYGLFGWLGGWLDIDAEDRLWNTVQSLIMIGSGVCAFGIAALRSGALSEEDLALVPVLHRFLAPLMGKKKSLKT